MEGRSPSDTPTFKSIFHLFSGSSDLYLGECCAHKQTSSLHEFTAKKLLGLLKKKIRGFFSPVGNCRYKNMMQSWVQESQPAPNGSTQILEAKNDFISMFIWEQQRERSRGRGPNSVRKA